MMMDELDKQLMKDMIKRSAQFLEDENWEKLMHQSWVLARKAKYLRDIQKK